MRRELLVGALAGAVATLGLSGCASDGTPATQPNGESAAAANDPTDLRPTLPERAGPRRETSGTVPHIQRDATPVPEVDAELRRRAFRLPGVTNLPSDRSLPGARGLALSADAELARPDVISGSREFAHIHPDGSLHVWLPVDRALEVDRTKWGELHPWVSREGFWDGVVMVYTPETLDELDVTLRIVVDAYNFVTGSDLAPEDIP